MTVNATALIHGHPWDLWGLAKLYNGSGDNGVLVKFEEPSGQPNVNFNDPKARERFQRSGYSENAPLTAKSLTWTSVSEFHPAEALNRAQVLVTRINGIAKLLDPNYWGVRLISVTHQFPGGGGGSVPGGPASNKGYTNLGRHISHMMVAPAFVDLASRDPAVEFVLEAFGLPISWSSLYLVYDCIASTVGGVRNLPRLGGVSRQQLDNFAYTANTSRNIRAGIRHGNRPDAVPPRLLIPLHEGHTTIMRLAMTWLETRTKLADLETE